MKLNRDPITNRFVAVEARPCSIEACERHAESRGWCIYHYHRWRDTGDPLTPPNRVPGRTHGMSGGPTYRSWCSMIRRCGDRRPEVAKNYIDRGITVCSKWRESFEAFLADMGERPEGTTIDRIDNDGNYEPSNCRWATWSQQQRNKRPMSAEARENHRAAALQRTR